MICPACEKPAQPGEILKVIDAENVVHMECYRLIHNLRRLLIKKRFARPVHAEPRRPGRPCQHFWVPITLERSGRLAAVRCDKCREVRTKQPCTP